MIRLFKFFSSDKSEDDEFKLKEVEIYGKLRNIDSF